MTGAKAEEEAGKGKDTTTDHGRPDPLPPTQYPHWSSCVA